MLLFHQFQPIYGVKMNFTFTWILDKFGFTPKIETFDFKPAVKKVAKKATKVAAKKTTRKAK